MTAMVFSRNVLLAPATLSFALPDPGKGFSDVAATWNGDGWQPQPGGQWRDGRFEFTTPHFRGEEWLRGHLATSGAGCGGHLA